MTQTKTRNLYEGMFLLSAAINEAEQEAVLKRLEDDIVQRGGEVLKKHDFGRRQLAYEVEGQREGHYFLWYYEAPPEEMKEMWFEYRLHRKSLHLLRFMTLRADKVPEEIKFKPVGER